MTRAVVIRGCDALLRPGELRSGVDLHLDDGRIVALHESCRPASQPGWEVVNRSGLLTMPGLINPHTHSPENCLRGASESQDRLRPSVHIFHA